MARQSKNRAIDEGAEPEPARASEHPDFPGFGDTDFAPMQSPTELTAALNATELEQARAEQARQDLVAIESPEPAEKLPRLPREESAPVSVEQATQQLIEATTPSPTLTPAEFEARRFEAFKLDVYRVLYKHKYVLVPNALIVDGKTTGINVLDAGYTSRMKRQLAMAGCVESLVNLTGKVAL